MGRVRCRTGFIDPQIHFGTWLVARPDPIELEKMVPSFEGYRMLIYAAILVLWAQRLYVEGGIAQLGCRSGMAGLTVGNVLGPYAFEQVTNPSIGYSNSTFPVSATSIRLGGIFPLTDSSTFRSNIFGVQRLEIFRYLMNLINSGQYGNVDPTILFTWRVIDSELIPGYALSASLDFIKNENISIVIGPNDSQETAEAAEILGSRNIGTVSYSSSAALPSNLGFDTLLRTVPSDEDNNMAIIELIQSFGWSLISAVFTDDIYGTTGKDFFLRAVENGKINMTCMAVIPVISTKMTQSTRNILTNMANCLATSSSNVVLVYASVNSAAPILGVLSSNPANNRLTYIATAWITFVNDPITFANGQFELSQLKGTVAVIPTIGNTSEFETYYYNLNPSNNNYSFFVSFWEDQFKCFYTTQDPSIPLCPDNTSERTLPISCRCTGTENLSETQIDLKLGYVWDAVLGVWYSINSIIKNCNGANGTYVNVGMNDTNGLMQRMANICNNGSVSGLDVISVMRHSSYIGSTGFVEFSGTSRANPSFDIIQVNENGEFTEIGYYNNSQLYYNASMLEFKGSEVPESYVVPDDFTFATTQGAIIGAFAGILAIVVLLFAAMIIRNKDAPPIKRSSPLFLLLMCAGTLLLLIGAIVTLIPQETGISCFLEALFLYLGLGLILGSLMAKTYRIYRIFHVIRIRKKPYSNKELCLFVLVVSAVEVMGVMLWVILGGWPAPYVKYSQTSLYSYTVCIDVYNTSGTIIFLSLVGYNILLILISATLAILTRNVRSEYNESRNIGLAIAGTSIVVVVGFALIAALQGTPEYNYYRDEITVVVTVLVSLVCMIFLFVPLARKLNRHSKFTNVLSPSNISPNYPLDPSLYPT